MRFSSLRLSGFKSFADPAELALAPGLAGIVGPNGCGKSNIAEAFRWAMGETAARTMRGDRMEDLIFAGAQTRPPRRMAEVGLKAYRDSRGEARETEITRTITRGGGAGFRIDGRPARARDVRALFADAATGAESPAIVRQGRVAALVAAKAAERRRLLEDAAGIAGLHTRREEALGRLQATQANLERIAQLCADLDTRARALEEQSATARRYRDLSHEIRRKDIEWRYRRLDQARRAARETEDRLTRALQRLAGAERSALAAERARTEAQGLLETAQSRARQARENIATAQDEKAAQESALQAARHEAAALQEKCERLAELRAREDMSREDAEKALERLAMERAASGADDIATDDELAALAAAEEEAAARLARAEEVHDARARAFVQAQTQARMRAQAIEENERAVTRLEADIARDCNALETARDALMQAKSALPEAAREVEERTREEARVAALLKKCRTAREQTQETRDAWHAKHAALQGAARVRNAEIEGLRAMLARTAQERGGEGDLPAIDSLSVAPGHEAALAALLGAEAEAPIVEGEGASGWRASGKAADPPVAPEGARPLPMVGAVPPALARAIDWCFLCDCSEGERLAADLRPGMCLVSRKGDLWRWDGYRRRADADSGEAARSAHLRLANRARLDDLVEEAARSRGDIAAAERERQLADARLVREKEDEARARSAVQAVEEAARQARRTKMQAGNAFEAAGERVLRLERAIARDRERLEGLRQEAQGPKVTGEDASPPSKQDLHEAQAARRTCRAQLDSLRARRHDRSQARAHHVQAQERIARDVAEWAARKGKAEGRIADLAREAEKTGREKDEKLSTIEGMAQLAEAASLGWQEACAASARAEESLKERRDAARTAEKAGRETETDRVRASERYARRETEKQAAEGQLQEEEADFARHSPCSPGEAPSRFGFEAGSRNTVDALAGEIADLKRAREALGAVNLRAETEYETLAGERDELMREQEDLHRAVERLRQAISLVNKEGRSRLVRAFAQVDAHFQSLFTRLFGGGKASLAFVESDDPIEAGLEVFCAPPGKKTVSLALLSGGEQTLVAIALIFAMFLANPAPICLLDEVDGPLDDANVLRFCALLRDMAGRTDAPFLVITHNPLTMARMDRLYGVTMGERGVSQIVSVDLGRAIAGSDAA